MNHRANNQFSLRDSLLGNHLVTHRANNQLSHQPNHQVNLRDCSHQVNPQDNQVTYLGNQGVSHQSASATVEPTIKLTIWSAIEPTIKSILGTAFYTAI
jgi:hypothetical protein